MLNKTVIITASIISLMVVTSVGIAAHTYTKTKTAIEDSTIEVTGKAERSIIADKVKWSVSLRATGEKVEDANKTLEQAKEALKTLITDKGVSDAEYSFQAVQAYPGYKDEYSGYVAKSEASQIVVIESSSVEKLGELNQSLNTKPLLNENAFAYSQGIEFSYSERSTLEQEMLEEALANARSQAQHLMGDDLGKIVRVKQSVLSITSGEIGSNGYYPNDDRSSIKKKAVTTVMVVFSLK